ncbi:hypothetical protein A7X12_08620 [Sphingomonas sp. TDK1]|nr:hypothetical protein A7X12_08620 [Sphingomonas sp. TDK1]
MVREASLRSMLAARLALSGIDVVSMERVDPARIARLGGVAPVLVADLSATREQPGGLPALCMDPLWQRLIVVGAEVDAVAPHLHHVSGDDPAAAIAALLRDGGTMQ